MVKLVYTLASGASPRKWVGVQVPLRAQKNFIAIKLSGSSEGIPLGKLCSGHQFLKIILSPISIKSY